MSANGTANGIAPHPIPDALSGRRTGTARSNSADARRFLEYVMPPGSGTVLEMRIFKAQFGKGNYIEAGERFQGTFSGWLDNHDSAIVEAGRLNGVSGYITLNPVKRDLFARSANKLVKVKNNTTDDDITCLRWMYIDIDPKRPTDVSSTDEELALAVETRDRILQENPELAESSIWGKSGNGAWLLVRVDLKNDERGRELIRRGLSTLADRYNTDRVEIDIKTKNPARVMCLPGFMKCKGSNVPERPWRLATIDSEPGRELSPFDIAGRLPEPTAKPTAPAPAPAPATHKRKPGGNRPGAEERYAEWMAFVDGSIQGQHGSKQLVKAASGGHGFGLSEDAAVALILDHFNPRCKPEWSEEEVKHAVANAYKNAEKPRGHLLDTDREPTRAGNGNGNGKAKPKPEPRGDGAGGEDAPEGPDYILGKSDNPLSCVANSKLWLDEFKPPYWARYDLLRRVPLLGGEPLTDQHVIELGLEIETSLRAPWAHEHIRSAILHLAHQNEFSPLEEYLNRLEWDGVPRIEEFFSDHYGVDGTAYHREVGRVLFLSAVARAYRPGCKVDTVPILIGGQGVGKSMGIAALCPVVDWFTDDIGNDMFAGKAGEGLQGKWIIELGELARVNRSNIEVVKSFISRQVDHYRPAYGRIAQDFPRTCVFVGTTNDDQPLQDIENRRYLPIRVGQANPGMIAAARDQLWAEAAHRYLAGEEWWTTLSHLVEEARQQGVTARQNDAWEHILEQRLESVDTTTVVDAAAILGIEPAKLGRSEQTRIGLALRKIGFKRPNENDRRSKVFVREICHT